MSARAQALAEQLERVVEEFLAVIEPLPEARWLAATPEEGRTVAALAHHIAAAIPFELRAFRALADGAPLPDLEMEDLHRFNARHAADQARCAKDEVLESTRRNARDAAAVVRGLSEEQLDRAGTYLGGGAARTVEGWIERVLIGHIRGHLASIRAAFGPTPAA